MQLSNAELHKKIEAAKAVNLRSVLKESLPKLGLRGASLIVGGKKPAIGDLIVFSQGKVRTAILFVLADGALLITPNDKQASCIHLPADQLKMRVHVQQKTVDGQKYPGEVALLHPPVSFGTWLLKALALRLKDGMLRSLLVNESNKLRIFAGVSNPTFRWEKRIVEILSKAKDKYYNSGSTLLTDAEYDYLEALLAERNPKSPILQQVGSQIEKGRKHELPVFMGSLVKVKNGDNSVRSWVKKLAKPKDTVIVSDKLDGASALLEYKNNKLVKAYSRGDGVMGQDITALVKLLPNVPKTIKTQRKLVRVRGEIIMPRAAFNKRWSEEYANPRNMVAGQLSKKEPNPKILKDCRFLAHSLSDAGVEPLQAMKFLSRVGFETVRYQLMPALALNDDALSKKLTDGRKGSMYEMDGLVLQISSQRALEEEDHESNPTFSVAFKDNVNSFTATIGQIIWQASRYGYLKPKLQLAKPVKHGGVTITHATCHNAGYVYQEKLGPGAVVEMIRSGDVIPYVVSVVKPAAKPQMPPRGTWVWNETGVDIVTNNADNEDVIVKANAHFFQYLKVDGVSSGIIAKLYEEGYTSIPEILNLNASDLQQIEGFQKRLAEKVYKSIRKALDGVDLPALAIASGCFDRGLGGTRMYRIWEEYGNDMFGWKGWTTAKIVEEVSVLDGVGVVAAKKFANGVPVFLRFWKAVKKHVRLSNPEDAVVQQVSKALAGMTFVFTGFRSPDLENLIERNGGKVSGNVAKGVSGVVAKDTSGGSSKLVKARQLGIPLYNEMQFKKLLAGKGAK